MVKICEYLQQSRDLRQKLLKYLEELEKLKNENLDILFKIVNIYISFNNRRKIFDYYKKINELLKEKVKTMNAEDLMKWLKRQLFIVKFYLKERNQFQALALLS